ncbi:hypothetical protein HYPDE_24958 [Hyphomicrobium denitrificans 1NES1]|uniref:Uncharacterized protein n=1 Tax=Hyphomicrobium denitrificans 1NES1 TaxID=670307 RepID=N0B810_9HYPH|nr:hypothetical protein [Hyphomicrobium denitrificans]AGK56676.1 hypothetical protein HYPDE_24958 [Hyphomicrobium denitrificans 1NES1]
MRNAGLGTLLVAAFCLASSGAGAQDQPPLQSSFTALLSKDYEVKSVTLVPLEVAKRATESVKTDTVVVTLQSKQSVAVCYIAFANWAFMNKTSLDTPTLCEVREGSAPETQSTPNPPPGTTP